MEWTREKTLALISEYRKRRGLWDMTSDDYRKKEMKHKLLLAVSASLGDNIPIVEIEKKFHTLRTQYHREINRMKRKEPYNSKWFGFKTLQFLSSPKACRSTKGRIKSEITEDGTVTTKYIIRESTSQHDTSGGSASSNNLSEEFVSIQRKPHIHYEGAQLAASTSRSQELEKLIEETTKDVEDIEEPKPKMVVPLEHHNYTTQMHATSVSEIHASQHDPLQHNAHEQHHVQEEGEPIDAMDPIDIQGTEEEVTYQATNANGVHSQQNIVQHHHAIPTRIIKISRRGDTCTEEDYYEEEQHHHQQPHIHAVPTNSTKRIYYEDNGHAATIITPGTSAQPNGNAAIVTSAVQRQSQPPMLQSRPGLTITHTPQLLQQGVQPPRDDFTTYGEYVANEMRGIMNREILVALKHKINTALFEASMAELQK